MMTAADHQNVLNLVDEAGAAIMAIYAAPASLKVDLKSDNTPLTQADLAAHRLLYAGLTRLFPNVPVISEEGDAAANEQMVLGSNFWLVDPLDGTKEFIAHNDEFTVCVARIESGQPVFGVVAAPALGLTYYGGPGMGSYKKVTGQAAVPIRVAAQPQGIVMRSRSHAEAATAAYIAAHFQGATTTQVGSQLKFARVAEGAADAYPRLGSSMRLWDVAAGHAILLGAGGGLHRPDGTDVDYNTPTLLAGDFVAHASPLAQDVR